MPVTERDATMPACGQGQQVVKCFESQEYAAVSDDRLLKFDWQREPCLTFRQRVARFSQLKDVRMAIDYQRHRKLPQYFKWTLYGSHIELASSQS